MSLTAPCVSISSPPLPTRLFVDTRNQRSSRSHAHRAPRDPPHMAPKSPLRSPDRTTILKTAGIALNTSSVEIHRLDDNLNRSYRLSDPSTPTQFCLFKCPPASNTRLLRHEHDRLSTDCHALQLLGRRKTLPATRQSTLLDHQSSTFALSGPYHGILLSDLDEPLTPSRHRALDRSLGHFMKRLNTITSPTFGSLQRPQHQSWARCFASILLDAIRDAEDGLVSLPYAEVREQLRRHWISLDSVADAKFTVTELPEDGIVFDERTGEVTGLVDYGSAMWADPLFGDYFVRASDGFMEGYGSVDGADARIRRLLYTVYHSLVAIVRQCFRPGSGGSEFEARRSLTTALQYLRAIAAS
ncbi:hypothetical protein WHR41_04295 [Cladosporium halotolerans]|uniref:Aminoglycoside phosphotransferase domain-containing protein n=1 Tax=Cladosporium halotolerans TaxID=1052096 RepID=A0AB34KV58_9PEZI